MRLRRLCFAAAAIAVAITLTGCPGNDSGTAPDPASVTVATVGGVAATVAAGTNLPFAATVLPAGAPDQVTWEARNPGNEPANAAISAAGVFNVPTDGTLGGLGTWTVRATTVAAPGVSSDWVNVELTAPAFTGISAVSPPSATITVSFAAGGSQQFTATTLPVLALDAIVWSVSPNPEGVSISQSGYLTVAAGTPAATGLTVTARAADTEFSTSATVTVVPPTGGVFTVDFAELVDGAATMDIEGPSISLLNGGAIEVRNPAGNISWLLGGTSVYNEPFPYSVYGDYGEKLTLTPATLGAIIGTQTGTHFVTAIVEYGGSSYSRRIAITVRP